MPAKFRSYYRLTKPGIIRGNLLTAIAGFLLASAGDVSLVRLLALTAGMALVIGGSCVYNNILDRGIDIKMERTRKRALVTGEISARSAAIFGTVLAGVGTFVLAYFVNYLTAVLGLFGLFMYVIVYGYGKRTTIWGTLIGSVSGAIPPVGGYAAASGRLDVGSLLLFLILTWWQMPHFYALGIYRRREYAAAGLPILPVVHGIARTRIEIVIYTTLFALTVPLPALFGYAGWVYLVTAIALAVLWLWQAVQGLYIKAIEDAEAWSRKMFGYSLLVLMAWCAAVAVDSFVRFNL
jgi:protoheme IX farnesyltransferase